MITALLLFATLWFGTTGLYVLVMHAKKLRDASGLNLFWTVSLLPWAVLAVALDVLFNLVVGTICFAELPHEWLFTHRVQRHVNQSAGWRLNVALFWMRQLNQIEPNHVRLPQ